MNPNNKYYGFTKSKNIFISLFLTFAAIALVSPYLSAQDKRNNIVQNAIVSDSSQVVNAKWFFRKIAGNVYFKQYQFKDSSLFNSNQVISIIEVANGALTGDKKKTSPKKGKRVVEIVADTDRTTVSFIARKNEAIAAVNGSFFNMDRDDSASVTYMRIDGKVIAQNQLNVKNEKTARVYTEGEPKSEYSRGFFSKAAIATKGGKMFILKAEDDDIDWESTIDAEDMLCTGPLLRIDGKDEELENNSFNNNRHNRTGIATLKDGTLLLITVDGRSAQANGMSLKEFRQIGKWLGAVDMVNMDGGGSTTMFIDVTGIVNYPSDNKTFDHAGERKVANAIIVKFRE